MATSFELATKFQPILDEIYKAASLTASMDAKSKPVDFAGASVVKVYKNAMLGLGTYSRSGGYPAGQVVGTWEVLTLAAQRGRKISIDRMDDEETLGMAFGSAVSELIRTVVVPEVDAYRFSKYAAWSGVQEVSSPATLTKDTILAAIDVASAALNANEVPTEGRKLFLSDTCYGFLEQAISRTLSNERAVDRRVDSFSGMEVIMVPQSRFYKGITLDAGGAVDEGGYAKTVSTGRDINFMLMHPSAVLQVKKHEQLKIFSPDENQTMDAWAIQYRIYHDAFVFTEKVKGVYSHIKGS